MISIVTVLDSTYYLLFVLDYNYFAALCGWIQIIVTFLWLDSNYLTLLVLDSNYLILFMLDSNHLPCYVAGLKLLATLWAGF